MASTRERGINEALNKCDSFSLQLIYVLLLLLMATIDVFCARVRCSSTLDDTSKRRHDEGWRVARKGGGDDDDDDGKHSMQIGFMLACTRVSKCM